MALTSLPFRMITWVLCAALGIAMLPIVLYLRAYDALDDSADVVDL